MNLICDFYKKIINLVVIIMVFVFSNNLLASVVVSSSFSKANNELGVSTISTNSWSIGLEVSLGSYIKLGVEAENEDSDREGGFNSSDANKKYTYLRSDNIKSYSLNFKLILYNGRVLVPFIKAGLVFKEQKYKQLIDFESEANKDQESEDKNIIRSPSLGAGFALKLNRRFSLNIYTQFSNGLNIDPVTFEKKVTILQDNKNTIGLSYQLY